MQLKMYNIYVYRNRTHLVIGIVESGWQYTGVEPLIQLGRAPEILVTLGGEVLLHVGRYAAVPLPKLDGNEVRLAQLIRFRLGLCHLIVIHNDIAQLNMMENFYDYFIKLHW